MDSRYAIIIDTDQYSGNFEREMCAYCTGQVGDCGVGEEEQALFDEKYGDEFRDNIYELIEQRSDDHGCFRPCSIEPTPGYCNNGMGKNCKEEDAEGDDGRYPAYQSVGIYFYDKPSQEIIDMIKERAAEFVTMKSKHYPYKKRTMKILGFRLITELTTSTETEI